MTATPPKNAGAIPEARLAHRRHIHIFSLSTLPFRSYYPLLYCPHSVYSVGRSSPATIPNRPLSVRPDSATSLISLAQHTTLASLSPRIIPGPSLMLSSPRPTSHRTLLVAAHSHYCSFLVLSPSLVYLSRNVYCYGLVHLDTANCILGRRLGTKPHGDR